MLTKPVNVVGSTGTSYLKSFKASVASHWHRRPQDSRGASSRKPYFVKHNIH